MHSMSGCGNNRADMECVQVRLGAILGSGASGEVRLATVSGALESNDHHLRTMVDGDASCLELSVQTPIEAARGHGCSGLGPQAAIITPNSHWYQHRPLALKCVWGEDEIGYGRRVDAVTATASRRNQGSGIRGSEAQRNALRHEAYVLERLGGCPGVVQTLSPGLVNASLPRSERQQGERESGEGGEGGEYCELLLRGSNVHVDHALSNVVRSTYEPAGQVSAPSVPAGHRHYCTALGVEFMPGGSLSDLRKRWWQQHHSPLPPSLMRHCMREVTAALAGVHGRGVVHGDVKGRNALVAADGSVRLCDFGSASILWEGEREREGDGEGDGELGSKGRRAAALSCPCMHRDGQQEGRSAIRQAVRNNEVQPLACEGAEVVEGLRLPLAGEHAPAPVPPSPSSLPCPHRAPGTIFWMSPEAARQHPLMPASDVWSLGCLLLEMASGVPPWSINCSPVSALYRIACTPDLPAIPLSLSLEGRDFVSLCLRRDPVQRPSAADLLHHPFLLAAAAGRERERERERDSGWESHGHSCEEEEEEEILRHLLPPCCLDTRATDLCSHSLCSHLLKRAPAPLRVELPFPAADDGHDGEDEGEEEDEDEEEDEEDGKEGEEGGGAGRRLEQTDGCVICSWRALATSSPASAKGRGQALSSSSSSSSCKGDLPSPTSVLARSYEDSCTSCSPELLLLLESFEMSAGSVSFEIDPQTREPTIRDVAVS